MFGFSNPGQFFSPAQALHCYKNMEVNVAGGIATVSVNKYRNANNPPEKGGTKSAERVKDQLKGVAKDAWTRAGGSVKYVEAFMGKGSPWTIAAVLETFAAYSDAFIKAYGKTKGTPERVVADILADDSIEWEETLQQVCDYCFGLDCNGFVGNWLKVVEPHFKLHHNHKADEVRTKAKTFRTELSQIEYWDVMCYAANEHIAAIERKGDAPDSFMVVQSAGGGPRMNEYKFVKVSNNTFRLAAPTKNDIGGAFYVISLW